MSAPTNAVALRNPNPTVAPDSAYSQLQLAGLSVAPACATVRDTPKNLPRASAGATSVPSVCMLPDMTFTDMCTATNAAMNHAREAPVYAVTARKTMDSPERSSPGMMVYFRPNRSIT